MTEGKGASPPVRGLFFVPHLVHIPQSGRGDDAQWRVLHSVRSAQSVKSQRATYQKLLQRGLVEVCGMSKEHAALFTTQTWRRTGDTLLAKAGRTQEQRMGAPW